MSKKVDSAGMWRIVGNPITKAGIYKYTGKSIDADGAFGLIPDEFYSVLRPIEELEKAADSFNGKPLINSHEMIGTDGGLTKPDMKNIGGAIYNVRKSEKDDKTIVADLEIFSEEIQKAVQGGKKELSIGYWCKYRKEEGEYNGEHYDFVQYDLEGNHIALVDRGRMGSDVRVFDSTEQKKQFVYDSMEIGAMGKNNETAVDELRTNLADLLQSASEEELKQIAHILAHINGDKPIEGDPKYKDDTQVDEGEKPEEPIEEKGKDEDEESKGDEEPKDDKPAPVEEDEPSEEESKDEDEKKRACDHAELMKSALKELAKRERIYKAVEPLVGSFDHDDLTAREIAKYASKKLGIATVDGAEVEIVEAHLAGRASRKAVAKDSEESSTLSDKMRKFLGV